MKTGNKPRKMRKRELDYNKRVIDEIVKPVKQAAERAFKKHGLGKPRIIVVRSVPENKTKLEVDIKKARPWRPK